MRNAHQFAINGKDVHLVADVTMRISELRSTNPGCMVELWLSFDDIVHGPSAAGLPQLYFDQLSVIQAHIQAACTHTVHATSQSKQLTRRMLLQQEGWPEWEKAEFKQLDAYHSQGMFGMPQMPTPADIIFYWVWVYAIKQHENNRKKAHAVCDGSTRGNQAVVHGHTFAPMPDMANLRLQLALAAFLGLLMFTADVTNAFAEADRPKQQYCMQVDDAFLNWWNKHFPQQPLPRDAVIPIDKNLQGHPEGPCQWSIHIDRILRVHFGLTPTTHAPCLHSGVFQGHCILFLQQVDDFAIACAGKAIYDAFCDDLDKHLSIPITCHGLMQHYNGVDIVQTAHYISILVKLYLKQVLQSHGWESLTPVSLPMKAENEHV
jgi:Reverse transcriptase (RNA-dependent DNA polymerase)